MNKLPISDHRQHLADLLRYCTQISLLTFGLQLHCSVTKLGLSVDRMLGIDLLNMYAKCRRMDLASQVFDQFPQRNVVSWTALMCGYVQRGDARQSLQTLHLMISSGAKPNDFTLSTNLKACGMLANFFAGAQIHAISVKSGLEKVIVVGNSVVDMYSKCGRVPEAESMFRSMKCRNLVNWNTMIAAYTGANLATKALSIFHQMKESGETPDEFTFTSLLKSCSDLRAVKLGTQVHSFLILSGFPLLTKLNVASALIDHYIKQGNLLQAHKVFLQSESNHSISGGLIAGYAQEGNFIEAAKLFKSVRELNIEVDGFALSSMLGVFADIALVEQGKQMHAYCVKVNASLDISVSNAIADMYFKCGKKAEAEKYFNKMREKGVISWTSMITGYGKHGDGIKALSFFDKMQEEGIEPDGVAYLAVLCACSHSGMVKEGKGYFKNLKESGKVVPSVDHYACMVDLYGRNGFLNEAKELINEMPMKPSVGIWQAMLSACRVHKDLKLGVEVGDILLRADGDNPVNYVMISNMYAIAGEWQKYEKVREMAKMRRLKKEGGMSWVEVNKKVSFFYGGDDRHVLVDEIKGFLRGVEVKMKEELGYVCGVYSDMHDVEDESKEENIRVHSERLAVGFALMSGWDERKELCVFKNLRICGDCHQFFKGLAKVCRLVILVRDANRFHRFEDGLCSCRDYW